MQSVTIDFSETDCFDPLFLDFIKGKAALQPFYHHPPTLKAFADQIELKKNFSSEKRAVLASSLKAQYSAIERKAAVDKNIALITSENTFTITTGHQLNIFTGPLYFIYKILTVINAAKKLKTTYPEYNFVPVYWMATEDHDLEEISYFNYEGKKIKWDTRQAGPVGRMQTDGLADLTTNLPANAQFFQAIYKDSKNLAEAVRKYVHQLFGDDGLVVVDADDAELKKSLVPVIEDDLLQHNANKLSELSSEKLAALGYKTQGFPRAINFFYLDNGIRERIELQKGSYVVLNTDLRFSEQEIIELAEKSPEKFSPNVMLRPLYQELIMPNLSYTGGPAEVAYWLQLKSVFDHFKLPFPILLPRNFALLIDQNTQRKINANELAIQDVFKPIDELETNLVKRISTHDLTTSAEWNEIKAAFDKLIDKSAKIDPTLKKMSAAYAKKTENSISTIEKKLLRAEKRQLKDKTSQLLAIKQKLFPNGSLQERHDNFLNFYGHDDTFIDKIKPHFDPFNLKFHVIYLHE